MYTCAFAPSSGQICENVLSFIGSGNCFKESVFCLEIHNFLNSCKCGI